MSGLTYNQFKSTTIYGNFRNSDYVPSSGTGINANAIFDRDVSISGNLSVSGNTTYNSNLPTSTITCSNPNQFTIKSYVDSVVSSLSGLLSLANTWTGSSNIFNNTVQILSGNGLLIGNGQSDSSTQKLRLSVNATTGKTYMDWTGDNNLYMVLEQHQQLIILLELHN